MLWCRSMLKDLKEYRTEMCKSLACDDWEEVGSSSYFSVTGSHSFRVGLQALGCIKRDCYVH